MKKQIIGILTATFMILPLAACGAAKDADPSMSGSSQIESQSSQTSTASADGDYTPLIDASGLFSDRDRKQTADISAAESITLSDGKDFTITKAGGYMVKGSANNATIIVDAGDDDEIQLVLDSVSITNEDAPAIYVKNAGKTYVTTTSSVSTLTTTGTFTADGSTEIDAVIFSRDDLVLNGTSTLKISSTDNAVKCNDDIRVTGGTYIINCDGNAFAAHNSIAVAGGDFTLNTMEDGFHAKDSDDDTKGFVFISGGTFDITADQANEGDGIHGTTLLQIDGGTFKISAGECIEATCIQINGGTFDLYANDDGINASNKSASYTPVIEVNGGDITLEMAQGDTDGFDSNGYLYINGGTLNITAQSPFDYDYEAEFNGGTIIVNGKEATQITNQFEGEFGGPGNGEFGGPGGMNGGGFPGVPDGNQGGGFGGPGGQGNGGWGGEFPDDWGGEFPGNPPDGFGGEFGGEYPGGYDGIA